MHIYESNEAGMVSLPSVTVCVFFCDHVERQEPLELLWSRREWQTSQTRTGLGYDGSASSLLEQLLQ